MGYGALTSGGKDSSYALHLALEMGINVTRLITVRPERDDSYMYHAYNLHLMELYSKACGIPLVMEESSGIKEEELDDLKRAILKAEVDGVVTGAIASEYQASRIGRICRELEVEVISPLWHRNGEELLREMAGLMEITMVHVSAEGLDQSWLGRRINEAAISDLLNLMRKYRISVVGEGGEYETLVTNAPFFKKRMIILEGESKWYGNRGTFEIRKAELE